MLQRDDVLIANDRERWWAWRHSLPQYEVIDNDEDRDCDDNNRYEVPRCYQIGKSHVDAKDHENRWNAVKTKDSLATIVAGPTGWSQKARRLGKRKCSVDRVCPGKQGGAEAAWHITAISDLPTDLRIRLQTGCACQEMIGCRVGFDAISFVGSRTRPMKVGEEIGNGVVIRLIRWLYLPTIPPCPTSTSSWRLRTTRWHTAPGTLFRADP